jgi:hypothetical protein
MLEIEMIQDVKKKVSPPRRKSPRSNDTIIPVPVEHTPSVSFLDALSDGDSLSSVDSMPSPVVPAKVVPAKMTVKRSKRARSNTASTLLRSSKRQNLAPPGSPTHTPFKVFDEGSRSPTIADTERHTQGEEDMDAIRLGVKALEDPAY